MLGPLLLSLAALPFPSLVQAVFKTLKAEGLANDYTHGNMMNARVRCGDYGYVFLCVVAKKSITVRVSLMLLLMLLLLLL
jgi:hypothetical protein